MPILDKMIFEGLFSKGNSQEMMEEWKEWKMNDSVKKMT